MNKALWDFQLWLNLRRKSIGFEPIGVDGLFGPRTRNAIFETFRNKTAEAATPTDIAYVAGVLGVSARQVAAVGIVEGAGSGWDKTGLLSALYERHYAWKRLQVKIPLLSDPKPGGYTIDADGDGINDSWEKVADLCARNPVAAFESASWGKFQIMGAHWKSLCHNSVFDFVWALSRNQRNHYLALAGFIEKNQLVGALRRLSSNPEDCRAFARGYNGKNYTINNYHIKLAEAMR